MKRIILVFFFIVFCYSSIVANEQTDSVDFRASKQSLIKDSSGIQKNAVIIDVFYGYPFFDAILLFSSPGTNYNHLGIRAEYLGWKDMSIGIEYTYAHASKIENTSLTENYILKFEKQRILAKFNYYFFTREKGNAYITLGYGYKNARYSNDNSSDSSFNNDYFFWRHTAMRYGIGVRYYFIKALGLNLEVGFGGPLVQGGLTFKF